jgi:hypothetical protein
MSLATADHVARARDHVAPDRGSRGWWRADHISALRRGVVQVQVLEIMGGHACMPGRGAPHLCHGPPCGHDGRSGPPCHGRTSAGAQIVKPASGDPPSLLQSHAIVMHDVAWLEPLPQSPSGQWPPTSGLAGCRRGCVPGHDRVPGHGVSSRNGAGAVRHRGHARDPRASQGGSRGPASRGWHEVASHGACGIWTTDATALLAARVFLAERVRALRKRAGACSALRDRGRLRGGAFGSEP